MSVCLQVLPFTVGYIGGVSGGKGEFLQNICHLSEFMCSSRLVVFLLNTCVHIYINTNICV